MKFLLSSLLLLGGLNLILARSIYWGPFHTHSANPWPIYEYGDELFDVPLDRNSDEESDLKKLGKFFDESSENSHENKEIITSDEIDDAESLKATELREITRFLNVVLSDDIDDEETNIDDKSSDDSKEHKKNQTKEEHYKSSEDSKETQSNKISKELDNDDDYDYDALKSILNVLKKDKTETDDISKESSKEKDDKNKSAENESDEADNSEEHVKDKESSEDKKPLDEYESKESTENLLVDTKSDENEEELTEPKVEINEKDIRELTAILITMSTLDDLMKIAESTSENEESLDDDEVNEKKLKQVNDCLTVFGSLLEKLLDESSEVHKEIEKTNNDNDNDSKNDDNNDDDTSVSLEFYDIENSKTNFDNHRYDIIQTSTATVTQPKPTSSPYLPNTLSSSADSNDVIQEYVEVREKLDTLQDNLLLNKFNLDKDFYNVIANESADTSNNIKRFANDIAFMRDNANRIKQSIEDMQDIKSKLYFHKLIKAALKEVQLK